MIAAGFFAFAALFMSLVFVQRTDKEECIEAKVTCSEMHCSIDMNDAPEGSVIETREGQVYFCKK